MIITLDLPHSTLKIEIDKVDWYRVCSMHIAHQIQEKNMFNQTCYK